MVLLILAGIWAAVLIPPILRARAEARSADSIVDFRHKLRVLQRTSPSRSTLRPVPDPAPVRAGLEPLPVVVGQRARSRVAGGGVKAAVAGPGADAAAVLAAARRARTIRRRRDVLFTLLMGMGTTFVLAMVLSQSALWVLHFTMDALFVTFLAVLVRMRATANQREVKLRLLPSPQGRPQPAPVLAMRRSASN